MKMLTKPYMISALLIGAGVFDILTNNPDLAIVNLVLALFWILIMDVEEKKVKK